jgi:Zn-dependent protease with chaperone function
MMMRFAIFLCLPALLAACTTTTSSAPTSQPAPQSAPQVSRANPSPQSVADYRAVVRRVEPVAEQACRQMRPNSNCDFLIIVDDNPEIGANAYQTYNRAGRPVLAMTPALLRLLRNRDEVAFVVAHEAAHHIEGHIEQTQSTAQTGAILGAVLGSVVGLDTSGVDLATNIGGTVGARRFSKDFELEADSLGARIAERAGYDALRGVQYFARAADPGDRFLGTHPPNADRIRVVQATVR